MALFGHHYRRRRITIGPFWNRRSEKTASPQDNDLT